VVLVAFRVNARSKDRARFLRQIERADIIMRPLKRPADRDIRPAGGIKP